MIIGSKDHKEILMAKATSHRILHIWSTCKAGKMLLIYATCLEQIIFFKGCCNHTMNSFSVIPAFNELK